MVVRFPFTDLSGAVPRPGVVLSTQATMSDFIVAFISKVVPPRPSPFEMVVLPSHPEFAGTGLRFPSIFKMNKVATLNRALMSSRLGRVGPRLQHEVDVRLRAALGL